MLLIMSDKELMERKNLLVKRKDIYTRKLQQIEEKIIEDFGPWWTISETELRESYYEKMHEERDRLGYADYNRKIGRIEMELRDIEEMLHPKQPDYAGSVYDEFDDFNDVIKQLGIIHGVKL